MANPLDQFQFAPSAIQARFAAITQSILTDSRYLRSAQFAAIGEADLAHLFDLYDAHFFGGKLGQLLQDAGADPVRWRLSNRMTRAAGKTIQERTRQRVAGRVVEQARYEIAISSLLLYETFRDEPAAGQSPRPVLVAGVVCANRLEALLRIVEHELLHLAEFLTEGRSDCAGERFQRWSRAIFGHAASVHTLITPVERAATVHSIRLGDRVAFEHGAQERVGVVQRITRRASVLVRDDQGRLYSDGQRYTTFLVPLDRLRPA